MRCIIWVELLLDIFYSKTSTRYRSHFDILQFFRRLLL